MSEGPPTPTEQDPWHIDPEKNPPTGAPVPESRPAEISPEQQEQLDVGLEFLGGEIRELADQAAAAVARAEQFTTEEGRQRFLRLSGKVRARAAMTFAAVALVGALGAAPRAEAGEGSRRAAYAGAVIAGEVDRELERSYYRAMDDANQIEYALRRMEEDANRFLYQMDQLSERIARTEDRINEALERNKPDQVRRYLQEKDRMLREQGRLQARMERLEVMMRQAEEDLAKKEKSAEKTRRIGTGVRILGRVGEILSRR